ncbi:hypothetical protein G6F46_003890 [Rhizopus delemar]|uniref:BHLH domain-containing protein n=2 Tax=Rhizopus TaxID=4842 RepID=A0A9P7CL21_9FUNG|nr:hypothetical protein G6F43_005706 [Rhizopus delemar]KAG1540681.1 hypothetical protein G6F51_008377 [Rhizopus arrhizus]KAG1452401.1 hypothetical protein G6F55_008698 [Rhizopus delemar]KAG1492622.1 hypothetical protein G6F54_009175 [Rhizopus delemar]KAG1506751.1 hypothetical protein G6F53_009462 [Rhizopus delemar]
MEPIDLISSLDMNENPKPIFLQKSDQLTLPLLSFKSSPVQPSSPVKRKIKTKDEKRDNHTASEQKRRNAIRSRFCELTELVPCLKDTNHSKSTILFKAVDYMKYLERKNKRLRDRLQSLSIRSQVEKRALPALSTDIEPDKRDLPQSTLHALLIHKEQQKQLQELQSRLQTQLGQHASFPFYHFISNNTNNLAFIIPHQQEDQ